MEFPHNTKFRITKKYYRDPRDAKVYHYFVIEFYGMNVLKSIFWAKIWKEWFPVTRKECYGGDCQNVIIRFDDLAKAQEYLKNLREPVYYDEVIECDDVLE